MQDVVCIIPARYASSRFPGKLLTKINGTSILESTYRHVCLCPDLSRCIIATDDERIAQHAATFHDDVVMTSTNCSTGTDRIAEVVRENPILQNAEMIINVQGDEPCIPPTTIQAVIERLRHSETPMATAITSIRNDRDLYSKHVVKCVKNHNNHALYFSRQPIPYPNSSHDHPYFRHIGIYGFRPKFLLTFQQLPPTPLQQTEDLEMLRILEHGYSIAVTEVSIHSPEVNIPSDIEEVRTWIKNQSLYS